MEKTDYNNIGDEPTCFGARFANSDAVIGNNLSCFHGVQFIDGGTMVSPTVFARRSLCYLMSDMPQEALGDAMQAQVVSPDWPTALYLQAAALFILGMENDAQETLRDGTSLESKKERT